MANNPDEQLEEESSPLLPTVTAATTTTTTTTVNDENQSHPTIIIGPQLPPCAPLPPSKENPVPPMREPHVPQTYDGLVVGRPVLGRADWSSGLFHCFGNHDHFCGSDLEVCLLGSIAPCVLFASNAERLGSTDGSFTNHCLTYTSLYLIGNSFFGWNCLAPWFSYTTRTAVRRSFNLTGNFEALARHCGCCGSFIEDELQQEQCEMACDFATHMFCHPCSLCQEAREIRRRLPHPGFNAQPVLVMVPPGAQTMGRH